MKWPWTRRPGPADDREDDYAARAREAEEHKLAEASSRDDEVEFLARRLRAAYETDSFARLIDEAFGTHR